jgi:hypothetical protein
MQIVDPPTTAPRQFQGVFLTEAQAVNVRLMTEQNAPGRDAATGAAASPNVTCKQSAR